ncbi:MAG: bifunctional shikimate kinase/3-dehydroquinate synthase, partial [Acidimicrobiia bacterium]|nr:bifunctional shikimate kinase/3-dehydroquinate synthase [Acidimicrobiia bacterium]
LVGMMGSGKSEAGRQLALLLGRRFVDCDELVAAAAGRSIPEIFEAEGEAGFRRRESVTLAETLTSAEPAVVATGGGVVTVAANRALLAGAVVCWLRARPEVLARRISDGSGRPLLAEAEDDEALVARLRQLTAERDGWYDEVADIVLDVDELSAPQLASALAARLSGVHGWPGAGEGGVDDSSDCGAEGDGAARVRVRLAERSYDVLVGPGVRHRLAAELAACLPAPLRRVAVVTSDGIGVDADPGAGIATETFTIPAGERHKSLATVEDLCRRFCRFGLTRGDAVVAVGGGLVTDVAGFAAAVYHRGIPVVFVPTTLLGQIDAAIGGKTGVNLPEGKNLVGAFWQPSLVLCDSEVLVTLPAAEYRSGLGEMAKYHFLGRDGSGASDAAAMAALPLEGRIARCVALKAEIVASDERESGRRMLLNYGHTLAHALEIAGGFGLRHGEAVAVGLVYAAEVARRLGRIDGDRVAEHRQVVGTYGLPSSLPGGAEPDELIDLFGRDKKAVGGLTLVLDGPSGPEPVRGVDRAVLAEALEAIR